MVRITKKMLEYLNKIPFKQPKWTKKWDAGCVVIVSMDWEHDTYAISAKEVVDELKVYLEKWPGCKKFKLDGKPFVEIDFVR